MTRPRILSATFVKTVNQRGRYGDGRGGHGLSLLVRETRTAGRWSKAWNQKIRIAGQDKLVMLGLGSYPTVTLAEARKKALTNKRTAAQGKDPRTGGVPTFRQATEKVIALHAPQWKPGGRTEEHWQSSLTIYAYPRLGELTVDKMSSAQVMACVSPLWHDKPEMARKVLRRIGAVMTWAIAQNHRTDNPADRKVISSALGKNTNGATNLTALPHGRVAEALRIIGSTDAWWATIAALRFLTLTATRSGEVRSATWDEIDLTDQTWTIPASRTKTGKEHRVPLSTAAMEVLHHSLSITGGHGLFFPGVRGSVLGVSTMSKLCKENRVGCVPHGMRSSFRDWCSETGVSREVAEQALSHVVKGVEGAYARSDLLDLQRPVMEEWGSYVTDHRSDGLKR